jgi:hypothetical protein
MPGWHPVQPGITICCPRQTFANRDTLHDDVAPVTRPETMLCGINVTVEDRRSRPFF